MNEIIFFLASVLIGFFLGRNKGISQEVLKAAQELTKKRLVVLKKKEPIPTEQENIENLEAEKRPIKTFYKR